MWAHIEESALNGVSHAARAVRDKRYGLAILWVLITLGLWGATGYLLLFIVADYYAYPVLTKVEVLYKKDGLDFPTVAICNHNPMRCSQLFQVSPKFPHLWEASGCDIGQQIESYASKVLTEFALQPQTKAVFDTEFISTVFGDGSGYRSPMVDFWAHLYLESENVLNMIKLEKFPDFLDALQIFLNGTFVDRFRRTWNPRTNFSIEHKYAVEFLQKAKKARRFRVVLTNQMLSTTADLVLLGASEKPETVALMFARTFLTWYAKDNMADDLRLQYAWVQAMTNTSFQLQNVTKRVINVTRDYFEFFVSEVAEPIHDVPSFVWLYGNPDLCKAGGLATLENTDRYLNWSTPASIEASPLAALAHESMIAWSKLNFENQFYFAAGDVGFFQEDDPLLDRNDFLTASLTHYETLSAMSDSDPDGLRLFIRGCTFRGRACDRAAFDTLLSLRYGTCYIFNPYKPVEGVSEPEPERSLEEGPSGGLSLTLAIQEKEYIEVPSEIKTIGAKIGIFPFGTPPNVEDGGMDVLPGQSTSIILREMALSRLPAPHPSDCQESWSDSPYKYDNYPYDYETCRRFCIGHRILDHCNCIDPYTNAIQIQFRNGTVVDYKKRRWCDFTTRTTIDSMCAASMRHRDASVNDDWSSYASSSNPDDVFEDCKCRPACSLKDYDIRTSAAAFPSRGFMEKLAEGEFVHPFTLRKDWGSTKESLLEVKIFFRSFDVMNTKEEPQHTPMTMASDVGGALGLLLGLCGINLIEILILTWDVLLGRKRRPSKTTDSANKAGGEVGYPYGDLKIPSNKHVKVISSPPLGADQDDIRRNFY